MKEFAELWEKLERSHVEERKVDLLVSYLKGEKDQDVSSALHLLLGRKVKRFCSSLELKSWGAEAAGVPLWLVEDSCEATGDIAEAVAMLLSDGEGECPSLSELLKKLRELEKGPRRKDFVVSLWSKLSRTERYLLNKVMGGGIKPGIEYSTLLRATALAFGRSKLSVAMALATEWDPIAENIHNLLERCRTEIEEIAFCLASPLDHPLPLLGQPEDWQIEWHWNGKRVQLIKGKLHDLVWSRHGEVVIHSSLELVDVLHSVPAGTVLDGMLIESEMKGQALFMAIDIPMLRGEDLRQYALAVRREKLERCREIITSSHFDISPRLSVETWEEVERLRRGARAVRAEGVIIKRLDSLYHSDRIPGAWWKVRGDPLTANVILMYLQRGERGAPATYTFGVWRGEELVPIAKTALGLSSEERREVDELVKLHSRERFGPVRTVEPLFVFEIGFRDVMASKRHKAGVVLRSPQILTRRRESLPSEATTLEELNELIRS